MSRFIAVAALMSVAAVAMLLWPLLRAARRASIAERPSAYAAAAIALVAVPVLAFELYTALSSWPWDGQAAEPEAHPLAEKVVQLERRLATAPSDVAGWMMLGRSYLALDQPLQAARAYREAYRLTNGRDADAIVALAEALTLADREALVGEAGELLEVALALAPDNQKTLWYAGLAAYAADRPSLALERWRRLLALSPPERLRDILQEQIAELEGRAGTAAATPIVSSGAAGIELRISLDPALAGGLAGTTPVFIVARELGAQGGPPVAVARRRVDELPLELTLTDVDSMLPGRKLSDLDQVRLIARVARNGTPVAQPGDLFGELVRGRSEDGPVELVIDRIVE